MNTQTMIAKEVAVEKMYSSFRRRLLAAMLLGSLVIAAPAIASAAPQQQQREVRLPRIDRRAIENLQCWVSNGHDTWCKNAQLVASAEMRRIALRRYAWLMPLAGDTRSIVWVPSRTEIITNQRD